MPFNNALTKSASSPSKPKTRSFYSGEVIFEEGSEGDKLFVVHSGSVRITTKSDSKQVTLGVLTKGTCFGEMAVMSHEKRGATAIANEDTELYVIDKKHVNKMQEGLPPIFRAIVMSLIKRVKSLNAFTAQKSDLVKPLLSAAHLLMLLSDSLDAIDDDGEASLAVADIATHFESILGYSTEGTKKLIAEFETLNLARIELINLKSTIVFQSNGFLDRANKALRRGEDFQAKLEYLDMSELAKELGTTSQKLMFAIKDGYIKDDAIMLRRSVVVRYIDKAGRHIL